MRRRHLPRHLPRAPGPAAAPTSGRRARGHTAGDVEGAASGERPSRSGPAESTVAPGPADPPASRDRSDPPARDTAVTFTGAVPTDDGTPVTTDRSERVPPARFGSNPSGRTVSTSRGSVGDLGAERRGGAVGFRGEGRAYQPGGPGTRWRRRRGNAGHWPVRRAWLVALAALLLAALLDAEALQDTAESQPFGWRHDVATALADPLVEVSRALHLTEPRHWVEDALGRPSTRPEPSTPASTTTTEAPTTTSTEAPGSSTTSTTEAPTTTAPARRVPTADLPLRLLVAGDSMTEALGPVLEELAEGTGPIDATRALEYSSGLTRPDYFDWPARLADLLAERDPEVVVLWLGANDAQGIQTPSGSASFGTDAWVAEYRSRVAATMDLLAAEDRIVYWLGEPVMRSADFDARMALITSIFREEAERRPGIRFVDTRPTFAGADGGYTAYLPDASGTPVLVRRDDGIHLTPAGASRLAAQLLDTLRSDWPLL